MKIQDLMVGDWIHRPNCSDQVQTIGDGFILGLDSLRGRISENELLPISLTPEIVKANGFEDISKYMNPIGQPKRIIFSSNDKRFPFYFELSEGGCFYWEADEIAYKCNTVHEFQHILRVCGINEFKFE